MARKGSRHVVRDGGTDYGPPGINDRASNREERRAAERAARKRAKKKGKSNERPGSEK